LDYKEKISLQQILTSNLWNNQSQSIPTSSSNFSITSDQYERVSVNLEIIEESISDELESEIKTRKTRVYKYWSLIETLESEEAAIKKIEDDWKFKRNYLTKEGDESVYVCKLNKRCKAEIRLFYNNSNETVSIFSNNITHDHSKWDEIEWGILTVTHLILNVTINMLTIGSNKVES
jgi:hypothetical protein